MCRYSNAEIIWSKKETVSRMRSWKKLVSFEKRPMSNDILKGTIGKHNGCVGEFTIKILSKVLKKKPLQTAYRRKNFPSSSVITTKLSPNLNQLLEEVFHCRDVRLENTQIWAVVLI